MVQIVVSDEQAKVIAEAKGNVTVFDGRGRCLGLISTLDSPEEIAEAKRRLASDQRRHTTAEVLSTLKSREMLAQKFISGEWGVELKGLEEGPAADNRADSEVERR